MPPDNRVQALRNAYSQDDDRASALRSAYANPSGITDFAQQFIGRGADLIDFLSKPLDLISGQDPPSSREMLGIPGQSETAAGRAGTVAFETAASVLPVAKVAQKVKPAIESTGKVMRVVRGAAREMGERFRGAPLRTMAIETTAGAGAGAGGYYAVEKYPDTIGAELIGEVLGGSSVELAKNAAVGIFKRLPSVLGARYLFNRARGTGVVKKLEGGFNKARETAMTPAGTRISNRLDRATGDRVAAARSMDDDLLEGLTPAQLSGDTGLMELERDLIESSDELRRSADEQINRMTESIKASMVFDGDVEITENFFTDLLEHSKNLTDTRLRVAARLADEKISRMADVDVPGRREAVNRIVGREVKDAFIASGKHETTLYDQIDQDFVLAIKNGEAALTKALNEVGLAQVKQINPEAIKMLHPSGANYSPIGTTIRDVRSLQSELRESSRLARAAGRYNEARISDNIADALIDDIGVSDQSQVVQTAVAYSRYKNEVFRQGAVGKLLGYVKTGDELISAGLTLERTLGLGGPNAREAWDDIIVATAKPAVREAMDDYIKKDFLLNAVSEGQLNRARAISYLSDNEELLTRMPWIKHEIDQVIEAGDASAFVQSQVGRHNLKQSRATLFIKESPAAAFDSIFAQGVRSPRTEMRSLVNMVERDETGQALQGLKSAFGEYLLKSIETGEFVSGQKLKNFMNNPRTRGAMETLFSRDEMLRLNRVMNTARRIDTARAVGKSKEGLLADNIVGKYANNLAGILGAMSGHRLNRTLGTGGNIQIPGMVANHFRTLLESNVKNPARRLITDALQDEKLFKEILLQPMTDQYSAPTSEQTRRLNAWVIGVLGDQALREEEE